MARLDDPGRRIMEESFAIIEKELGPTDLPPWAFAVVRRMIHATADFEFACSIRFHPRFEAAAMEALRAGQPVITDVEMIRIGILTELSRRGVESAVCFVSDRDAAILAEKENLTRSAAGIRLAAMRFAQPLVVIGNAPTALDEALNLVEQDVWRPSAIIAIPVGFVGVIEAKERLIRQDRMPYLTCMGCKGGSAVTAAAVNALLEWSARA